MSDIVELLRQMTNHFKPPMLPCERLVLDLGTVYPAAKLPRNYKRGTPKDCFYNSLMLSAEKGLPYVEGFGFRPGLFPMLHAWNLDKKGRVIDVTWDDPEKCEYFGIVIPRNLLVEEVIKNGYAGVLDDWHNHWEFHKVLRKEVGPCLTPAI